MVLRSVLLCFLLYGSLLPNGVTIQAVAAIAVAPLVIAELIFYSKPIHPVIKIVVPLFLLLALPGLLRTPETPYGAQKFVDLVTLTFFTALAPSLIRDKKHIVIFVKVWAVVALFLAIVSVLGGVGAGGIAGRAVGFGSNPIGLARPIATGLIVVGWLYFQRYWSQAIMILAAVIMLPGIFATGSKGPVLGAALGLIVVAISDQKVRIIRIFQVATVAGLLWVIVRLSPSLTESRLGGFILDPVGISDPIRADALNRSWVSIVDHPFGVGYGNWSIATFDVRTAYPHNIWVELAVEGGITLALVLILVTVIAVIRLFRQARLKPAAGLVMGLLSNEIVSVSLSGDLRARTFFFFLALAFGVAAMSGADISGRPGNFGTDRQRPGESVQ